MPVSMKTVSQSLIAAGAMLLATTAQASITVSTSATVSLDGPVLAHDSSSGDVDSYSCAFSEMAGDGWAWSTADGSLEPVLASTVTQAHWEASILNDESFAQDYNFSFNIAQQHLRSIRTA